MLRSLAITFSTYSKIPMPSFEFKDEDLKYCMMFFPAVGLAIGLIEYALYLGLSYFDFSTVFIAAVITAVPYVLNGGIHLDGYMDTQDALNSYGSREKKLDILKDPHIGAFSVIRAIMLIMVSCATLYQLIDYCDAYNETSIILALFLSEALIRVYSGYAVVSFSMAKKDGMLATIASCQYENTKYVLGVTGFIILGLMSMCDLPAAIIYLLTATLLLVYFKRMCNKNFGGLSGDLSGWYLEMARFLGLLISVIWVVIR